MIGRLQCAMLLGSVAAALPLACGGDADGNGAGSGGAVTGSLGGAGASATGGVASQALGGASSRGGVTSSGGQASGGSGSSSGGSSTSGGSDGRGGSSTSGGSSTTGGSDSSGGIATSGGSAGTNGGKASETSGGAGGQGGQDSAGAGAGGANEAGAGGANATGACQQTRSSRSARSAGFAGAYQSNYYPLYSASCVAASDCATACVSAGGTQLSCAASECVDSTPDYCLPPTYWFDFDRLLVEASSEESSAWIIMVNNPYRDTLLVSNFQFELPADAVVKGVRFSFNEGADSADAIGDYSVKALKAGVAVGLDRGKSLAWKTGFQYVDYGGATDLWGVSWTAGEVNSDQFGVALTPLYLDTAGNARAYVDFVKATVFYDAALCR